MLVRLQPVPQLNRLGELQHLLQNRGSEKNTLSSTYSGSKNPLVKRGFFVLPSNIKTSWLYIRLILSAQQRPFHEPKLSRGIPEPNITKLLRVIVLFSRGPFQCNHLKRFSTAICLGIRPTDQSNSINNIPAIRLRATTCPYTTGYSFIIMLHEL